MAAPVRDWSLESGERQTAATFAEVKANHRARYEWAAREIGVAPDAWVLDLFCGTGYGSRWIADQCRCSIRFAREHFGTPKIVFAAEVFPFPLLGTYDAIVSFESLEHVVNDVTLAQVMVDALRPGGRLLLSVPNERKLPHATFRNRFHVRHYTREQVVALFPTLTLDAWFGQTWRSCLRRKASRWCSPSPRERPSAHHDCRDAGVRHGQQLRH
jgi:SAM-dependent methyltransferase